MEEITKHINDTNASYRHIGAGDAKNTDLFLDNEHYELFQDCGEQITVRFDKTNLTQAILFIASILPRKFDQSANHYIVNYSDGFVFDQLAILDALFKEKGVSVNTFTQKWNARKDILKKNGEIDNRFYFNNLLKEVKYKDHTGAIQITKFTIRNYFAGGFSNLNIKKASDGIFDVRIDNVTEPYNDGKEDGLEDIASLQTESYDKISRQIIYYGAPGTGKSHKIKAQLEGVPKENIFRTTFHPDSDYSTFVGAYKPTMEKLIDKIYAKGELISRLTEMKEGGVTYSPQKFGAKYWRSLKQLNLSDKKDILQACGMSDNYTVEFDKGMAVGEEYLACSNESRIIYSFVPQAFLNAYMQAYRKPDEKIYLIIEEINRGNCAQIFGDLFQLLDRDANGKSEYTIKADADLKSFLEEGLGEDNPGIKDGELCLPSNLYIYATMNTSDQSLFPIDSAFKRRWDWEYEPIKYKNTDWKIAIDGTEYSWTSFQRIVNEKILRANSSEDKMLGDYFVNPSDGIITDKVLLNKILFYLWNDVCKDGEGDIFKVSETEDISFSELYGESGTKTLKKMMAYLGVTDPDGNKVTIENNEENTRL
ncbi:5-methylcytosine-specific restriction endonuclease subunit McrB [Bacteroides salyersiae]|uniref:AAA family ATPase n=1 Tax=Bacteroides salyersiae TaxID=291644 RepID=UPI0022211BD2|nr:AAA family ATPase [Bacteroides salyersiae]UYU46370.1 AAA family ATPase [Bacteroides salyersiae]